MLTEETTVDSDKVTTNWGATLPRFLTVTVLPRWGTAETVEVSYESAEGTCEKWTGQSKQWGAVQFMGDPDGWYVELEKDYGYAVLAGTDVGTPRLIGALFLGDCPTTIVVQPLDAGGRCLKCGKIHV